MRWVQYPINRETTVRDFFSRLRRKILRHPKRTPKTLLRVFCQARRFRRKLAQISLLVCSFPKKACRRRHASFLPEALVTQSNSKPNYCRINSKTLFGEILFILGHNVALCALTVVKVTRLPEDLESKLGKLLERKVEKSDVIGLEDK